MPDVIPVCQTRDLPPASFRFLVAKDTLALSYTLPTTRACSGLSPVGLRPCWAHDKAAQPVINVDLRSLLPEIEETVRKAGTGSGSAAALPPSASLVKYAHQADRDKPVGLVLCRLLPAVPLALFGDILNASRFKILGQARSLSFILFNSNIR